MKTKNEPMSTVPTDLQTILRNFLQLKKQLHDQTVDHRDCDVVGADAVCPETQNIHDEILKLISNGIVYDMQKLVGDADDLSSLISRYKRNKQRSVTLDNRNCRDLSILVSSNQMHERVFRLSKSLDQCQSNARLQTLCSDHAAMMQLMDELPQGIDGLAANLDHLEHRIDHLQQKFERSKRRTSGGGRRIQFDEDVNDDSDRLEEKPNKSTVDPIHKAIKRQETRQRYWGRMKRLLRQNLRPCLSFALFDAVTQDQGQMSSSSSSSLQLQRAKQRFSSPLRPVTLRRPDNEFNSPPQSSGVTVIKKELPPVILQEMERDIENFLDRQLRYTFRVVRPPSPPLPPPPPPAPAPKLPIAPTLPDASTDISKDDKAPAPTLTIPQPPAQQQQQKSSSSESLAAEAERRLTAVYQATEPDKVKKIPGLLAKYKGRESELIATIERKFGPGAGAAVDGTDGNLVKAAFAQAQQQSQLFKAPLSQQAQGPQSSSQQQQAGVVSVFGLSSTASGTTTPTTTTGFGGSGTSVFNMPKPITSQTGPSSAGGSSLFGSPAKTTITSPSTGFGGGFGGAGATGGGMQPSSLFSSPAKSNITALSTNSGTSLGVGFGQQQQPQGFGQGWGQQQPQQQQGQITVSADTARRRLMELYTMHNPSKIAEIPGLLEKYRGKEAELLAKAEKRYGPMTHQLQQQQQQQQLQFGGGFGGIASAPTPFGVGSSLFQHHK